MGDFIIQNKLTLTFDELPEIMTPAHLIAYLPLGRDAVYAALKSGAIRSVRVGQKFLVPKTALKEFIDGKLSDGIGRTPGG